MNAPAPEPLPTLGVGARIWRMLVAALLGWLAGFGGSSLVQSYEIVKVAGGDERLFLESVTHGLLVWAVITIIVAGVSIALVLGPIATLLSAQRLLRHPRLSMYALPSLALIPLCYRSIKWLVAPIGPYDFKGPLMLAYTVFIPVFLAVISAIFLSLLRRGLEARLAGDQSDAQSMAEAPPL